MSNGSTQRFKRPSFKLQVLAVVASGAGAAGMDLVALLCGTSGLCTAQGPSLSPPLLGLALIKDSRLRTHTIDPA